MTFTKDDFKRVLWTAAQVFVAAFFVAGFPTTRAAFVTAVAAGLSAVKNLVLADGTWAK